MTTYKHFCKTLFLVGISLSFSLYADQQLEVLEVKTSQSYEISKNLPGELLPFQQSKIAFEITGRISSIYVDIGDRVKKDDGKIYLIMANKKEIILPHTVDKVPALLLLNKILTTLLFVKIFKFFGTFFK